VRRVLRDDGTLWLNLGDSYVSTPTGNLGGKITLGGGQDNQAAGLSRPDKTGFGLPVKNLIGIPWRVAFALQADGWFLRQDIIWHKPNPMPESVTDRCTKAHEYIFLLSKSPKYFFDNVAIKEPVQSDRAASRKEPTRGEGYGAAKSVSGLSPDRDGGFSTSDGKRNKRSVWTVTTKPFKGAHFATFPPDLIEPCILAGSAPGDVVLDPFGGAGTVNMVCAKHGRTGVYIDLNPEYATLARNR